MVDRFISRDSSLYILLANIVPSFLKREHLSCLNMFLALVPILIILVIWLFVRLGLPLTCDGTQRDSDQRTDHGVLWPGHRAVGPYPSRSAGPWSPRPPVSLLEGERYVGSISKPRKKKKTIRRDIVKGRGDPVSGRVRFSPFVLVQEIPLVGKGHKVDN